MTNYYFYIILGILIGGFILERWLSWLNMKNTKAPVPEELKDVYEPERYEKSQEYKRANSKFSIITSTYSLILILIMFLLGGFAFLNDFSFSLTGTYIITVLAFFGILSFGSDILSLPFDVYDTFVIEEKFGFNKTTGKTFVLDKIKGWLLGAIIGGGILAIVVWFYQLTGQNFWIWAWVLVAAFTLFMTMFYSNLIVPLFNKQTPLDEGELRTAIEDFSKKAGFKLNNIYVIDGSKRSTKANAYFTGLGAKKRIVLYDTLINDLSIQEIVAVLAHEIGHYKKKHSLYGTALSIAQIGFTLFLFSLFMNNPQLSLAMGVEQPNFHISMLAFGILYTPISMVTGYLMNIFSRRNEFQADRFAAENYEAQHLISALKKLTAKNLSNLTPHPVYVKVYYSHPPLLQRIRAMKSIF
ncbi:MAG: M48 family metallopeptidase [Bacteroidales bacterium]|nr:M48 family metallopeptidase [Bacteroidales bacterium]MCF8392171.1 M48 family metallopeptidase [Bacteroidales bacterium]